MKSNFRLQYETLLLCFLMLLFAYSATLQFEFVVGDQYRAFRLPENFTKLEEFKVCVTDALPFYFRSGRPIVWVSECFERAFVSKISDLYFFRLLPIIASIAFVFMIGRVFSKTFGGGVFLFQLAAVFLSIMPGYQFFVLLGTNGLMVLLAPILSVVSSYYFVKRKGDFGCKKSMFALIFFVVSCYIYPAWALSAVPFSIFLIIIDSKINIKYAVNECVKSVIFYFFGTVAYFASIIIFVSLNVFGSKDYNITSNYDTNIIFDVENIYQRVHTALNFVFGGPIWNVNHIGICIFLGGFLSLVYLIYKKIVGAAGIPQRLILMRMSIAFAISLPIYFLSVVAPMGPWLLSSMGELNQRFFSFSFAMPVLAIFFVAGQIFPLHRKCITLIGFVSMSSALLFANKVVSLDVIANAVEIDYIRTKISDWIDNDEYITDRTVIVIPPYANNHDSRPAFMKSLAVYNKDYRVGIWTGSKTHFFELFSAIIRENKNHDIDRKLKLVNCPLDQNDCLFDKKNKNSILFYVLSQDDYNRGVLQVPTKPLVLDVASLTANPIKISIDVTPPSFPDVKSSTFSQFDSSGLLDSVPPGWHAEKNPKYPQILTIDLKFDKIVSTLSFLPQDTVHASRAPKSVRIKTSRDGKTWPTVAQVVDMCAFNSPDGWYKIQLPNKVKARFLEIDILSNCGDPEFLTLRGLKIE